MNRTITMYVQRFGAMALALSAAAAMSGCGQQAEPVMAEQSNAILAETITPQVGDLELTTAFVGTVEPDELVSVYPKVSGTVLTTYFQVGDAVKKGDLLFEIDPTDIQLSVDVAQAQLMAAQAQMDQALGSTWDLQMAQLESQVKQAQQSYSQARQSLRDYNDGNEDTMDELWEQIQDTEALRKQAEEQLEAKREEIANMKAGSPEWATAQQEFSRLNSQLTQIESTKSMLQANYNELDDDESATHSSLRSAVRNAQIAYDSATQIYELTKGEAHSDAIKVAQANLGSATASFNAQAQQLEYTKVYAPIDGVIEQCSVTEQGNASPASAAYTVSNKSTITVIFYVPNSAVEAMRIGDSVTVENGQRTYEGSLTEVGTMVDPQTGLFKVKAVVNCDDNSLLTGLSVKIDASTAKAQQAMLLPQEVVYYEDGQAYVYIAEDGAAVQTFIQVGISNEEMVEVVSGLSPDSQVISTWDPNLTDGAAVTLAEAASAPDASDTPNEEGTSPEEQAASSEEDASSQPAESAGEPADTASEASQAPAEAAASQEG